VGPHPGGPGGGDGDQPEDRERSVKGLRRGGLRTQADSTGGRRAPKYYAITLLTDRRRACRYPVVANRARLGWWSGADFSEVEAGLGDTSQGGALVVPADLLPAGAAFLRRSGLVETGWFPAEVLRTVSASKSSCQIAVAFPETCPNELFTGVRGFQLEGKGSSGFAGVRWPLLAVSRPRREGPSATQIRTVSRHQKAADVQQEP